MIGKQPTTQVLAEVNIHNQLNQVITVSIKPMCSTGITGQSSKRGTCVIPNTYLKITVSLKGRKFDKSTVECSSKWEKRI